MNLFDRRTPYEKAKEQCRSITSQIRKEKHQLDRNINSSDREIQRLSNDIRKHARTNNQAAIRILAKSIVKAKHNKNRLYTAKANLDSIDNAVKNQLANMKITGIMQKSNEISRSMAAIMKVEELQAVSSEFSKELMKLGIMEEMMSEAMDAAFDNPDLEEETDEEVQRVIDDIMKEKIAGIPSVVAPISQREMPAAVENDDSDEEEMERRLQALKS